MEKSMGFCHFVVQSVENPRGWRKVGERVCEIFSIPIVFSPQIVYTMTYRNIQGGTEKMKVIRFILKAAAVAMAVSAVVCLVMAYWDKIVDTFYAIADKVEEKKANCCFCSSEYDDYEDAEL